MGRQPPEEQTVRKLTKDLVWAREEAQRMVESRSWRYGHALARMTRRLTFRKPARREGAAETIVRRLAWVEEPPDSGSEPGSPRPKAPVGVLCFLWDVGEADLERLLGRVASTVGNQTSILMVTNSDGPAPLRRNRYHFEYVPPEHEWARHFPYGDYDGFLRERIAAIVRTYLPRHVLIFGNQDDVLVDALIETSAASENEAS